MENFIAFTFLWVVALAIVLSILNTIWKNIGCIFIGAVVCLISAIMFLSLGLHF
jgi:hypothetical protein